MPASASTDTLARRHIPISPLPIATFSTASQKSQVGPGKKTKTMIPLHPFSATLVTPVAALVFGLTSAPPPTPIVPVLEVVKVYGKLAGPQCYGLKAPMGSSCQIQITDLERSLGVDAATKLSQDEFTARLEQMDFQWPLKPYGIDKSLSKTAVMNKGAETRVFMDELESRGLYDRRNPTGPLPSSLRPALNKQLQAEGIDPRASSLVFRAFSGGDKSGMSAARIEELFGEKGEMDYYEFLNVIGTDAVFWPN